IGAAASLLVSPNIGNPDSAIMATQTLKVVLPQWPPIYPLFIRTINSLMGFVLWLLGNTNAPGIVTPNFSAAALKFVLLIHTASAIVAAAYADLQFRLRLIGSRCVAAVLYLNPFTLTSIHSLLSEAPLAIFLLLAVGSAVPILLYRDWALNRVVWFF